MKEYPFKSFCSKGFLQKFLERMFMFMWFISFSVFIALFKIDFLIPLFLLGIAILSYEGDENTILCTKRIRAVTKRCDNRNNRTNGPRTHAAIGHR